MTDLITIQRTVARMQRNHSLVAAVTATGTWPHYPESSCQRCKKACAHFTCWFPVWVYRSAAAAFKCRLVSELCSDPLAILIPIIEVRDKSSFLPPTYCRVTCSRYTKALQSMRNVPLLSLSPQRYPPPTSTPIMYVLSTRQGHSPPISSFP